MEPVIMPHIKDSFDLSQNMPAQPGTNIDLADKKTWKKFRKELLDLLHQTTTMNQAV